MICYSTDLTNLNENERKEFEMKTRYHHEDSLDNDIRQMFNETARRNK